MPFLQDVIGIYGDASAVGKNGPVKDLSLARDEALHLNTGFFRCHFPLSVVTAN